ncbi:hypothetical protein BJF89_16710 [Corynebacterium sp. CNJ-954]|uniref:hypothetical protein n=1 Tax=Corynebacterium sp. CNJ-954 TaxID=1904962 RepID=UPI000965FF4F|nr:hypothetical protein [Corynebacterium sp. CNJ-954]OLT54416.1 hypothetical protein BJF89_16710 [Corynebacterium sp. CNJ-954]
MTDIPRKPARSRHPLIPNADQTPSNEMKEGETTVGATADMAVAGGAESTEKADPYADPMYDTLVNLQVRVPLRVKVRLDELKKRDGGSIAGHVSTGLSEWLSTKDL